MIRLPEPPRVSVVMGVRNALPFLDEAVRSILDQTMDDFEFIIIDDASDDGTLERIRQFDDRRITVVENPVNLGLTKSLINGVGMARAPFVARMDADDLCHPERFERQLAYLAANPDVAVVGTCFHLIDVDGKPIKDVDVVCDPDELAAMLPGRNNLVHASVMFRKDAYLACGGYDPAMRYAQDYDLWLRMSERFTVANLPDRLFTRRWSEGCISCVKQSEQDRFVEIARQRMRDRRAGRQRPAADRPKVTVVITTYNRPGLLPRALQSLCEQRYPNIEVIVVNDGGEDVRHVVDRFSDLADLRLVDLERNMGLATARNTGALKATGKYVCYLDDDDAYLPLHLSTLVEALENSDYQVAYTDAFRASQHGESDNYRIHRRHVAASHDFDAQRILWTNYIPVLCVMHARACIEKTGLPDADLGPHADWDLWIRMSRHFDFLHIPEPTCEYAWHTGSTSMTSSIQFQFWNTRLKIYRTHHDYCRTMPAVVREQKGMLRYLYDKFIVPNEQALRELDAYPSAPESDCFEEYMKTTGEFFSRVDMTSPDHARVVNRMLNRGPQ
jgi:glycosyltransferase involved in cell wall biosynthesis